MGAGASQSSNEQEIGTQKTDRREKWLKKIKTPCIKFLSAFSQDLHAGAIS